MADEKFGKSAAFQALPEDQKGPMLEKLRRRFEALDAMAEVDSVGADLVVFSEAAKNPDTDAFVQELRELAHCGDEELKEFAEDMKKLADDEKPIEPPPEPFGTGAARIRELQEENARLLAKLGLHKRPWGEPPELPSLNKDDAPTTSSPEEKEHPTTGEENDAQNKAISEETRASPRM